MIYIGISDGPLNLALNLNQNINMKQKPTRYSSSPSRVMSSSKSSYEEIYARCEQLIELLHQRQTIRQICTKTGHNYRTVYRDIIRLMNLGYKVKNDTNYYWIDFNN